MFPAVSFSPCLTKMMFVGRIYSKIYHQFFSDRVVGAPAPTIDSTRVPGTCTRYLTVQRGCDCSTQLALSCLQALASSTYFACVIAKMPRARALAATAAAIAVAVLGLCAPLGLELYCAAATHVQTVTTTVTTPSTVFTHGENGFPCIRIPGTLHVPASATPPAATASTVTDDGDGDGDGVLLSFAAARSFTGDSCFPVKNLTNPKAYSAHVVKRSTDLGATWGPMIEVGRSGTARISPEGAELFHSSSSTVITIYQTDRISNTTTGLRLWQSASKDAGYRNDATTAVCVTFNVALFLLFLFLFLSLPSYT